LSGEEENPVAPYGASQRGAELILIEPRAVRREDVARIERGISQKFERISVQLVGPGLAFNRNPIVLSAECSALRREFYVIRGAPTGGGRVFAHGLR
jgi:hypothetical protein